MFLGIFAGLGLPLLAGEENCVMNLNMTGNCCRNNFDASQQNSQNRGEKKCPANHHHCKCCTHVMSELTEKDDSSVGNASNSVPRCRHENEVPPDGPFLSSEKPPLI